MAFLEDNCTFSILNSEILESCSQFICDHEDIDDFFLTKTDDYAKELIGKSYCFRLDKDLSVIVCAFTVANDSIKINYLPNSRKKKLKKHIPHEKHFNSYPAVLIGRLGVNKDYKRKGIGEELMTFIKSWFIDCKNKTGCRYLVVDSYNEKTPLKFYKKNGFDYLLTTEAQERKYLGAFDDNSIFIKLINNYRFLSKVIDITKSIPPLDTRLMFYDLIVLSPKKIRQ